MDYLRFKQVCCYGWKHAGDITTQKGYGLAKRIIIFFDIMYCFHRYKMWSNQYVAERVYELGSIERKEIGARYFSDGIVRDEWQRDFRENRKFLLKYSHRKYELAKYREKRNEVYRKRFNMGADCLVEHDVEISRQHYLNGTIKIGNNVLLAKNVFLDYSGILVIKDNVQITNGVIIETHHHPFHSDPSVSRDIVIPTHLVIEEGAVIGSRAIILSSCHYIGKNARVGAGAIVTKDVPDYTLVVGVPARVIKVLSSDTHQ